MSKTSTFLIEFIFLLVGCIKEDYPAECVPRELTELQKTNFGGKWRWYNTRVEQWFDIGPSNYYNYTPQSEGFEYYYIITDEGMFRGYRNDTLVHEFILNKSENYITSVEFFYAISFDLDCSVFSVSFSKSVPSQIIDTLSTLSYPINFRDDENHLISKQNSFVRVQ